jgi:hypothetical protein
VLRFLLFDPVSTRHARESGHPVTPDLPWLLGRPVKPGYDEKGIGLSESRNWRRLAAPRNDNRVNVAEIQIEASASPPISGAFARFWCLARHRGPGPRM